jgi:tRNA A-37 threonylcarbamoyl transferase component Bud32
MNPTPHLPDAAAADQTCEGPEHLQHVPITELQPNERLAGFRYRIVRMLGTGASGAVYLAYDNTTQSEVALKAWHGKRLDSSGEDLSARLGSEVRHARSIVHPNVCRVFDVTEANGLWFITMEYAKGGSLRTLLHSAQVLRPVAKRVADIRSVVEGLAAIHRAGIIHRDVKPENVLLMADGRLVVSDFGVARPEQREPGKPYDVAGTPKYMAPEAVAQRPATFASDVWSLGMVAHEVFFGRRPPFDEKRKVYEVQGLPRGASRLARQVGALVAQCLTEDPQARPQDATVVAQRLTEILDAERRRLLPRLARVLRRRRALGLAIGLLVLGGAGALLLSQPMPAPSPKLAPAFAALAARAPDLTASSRTIATWHERVDCLEVLPGGKRARVILGKSRDSLDVDLATGQTSPASLQPVAKATACPRLSPDGKRLLYTVVEPLRPPRIFLSLRPDGADGTELVQGKEPQWLPSGNELLYVAHTGGQPAILVLPDVSRTLPVTVPPSARVLRMALSETGDRIAVLTKDGATTTIDLVGFPDLKSLVRETAPPGAYAIHVDARGTLYVDAGRVLYARGSGGAWSAPGRWTAGGFAHLAKANESLIGLDSSTETVLLERVPGSPDRERARGTFGRFVVSPRGALLVEEVLLGGRGVISYQPPSGGALLRVSAGPQDFSPTFDADERGFVYVDRERREVLHCRLDGARACSILYRGQSLPERPALSPDGRHLLSNELFGDSMTVQVRSLEGPAVKDLGTSRCPATWADTASVWVLEAPVARLAWSRVDARSGAVLERRPVEAFHGPPSEATLAQKARCPLLPNEPSLAAERIRTKRETVVKLRALPSL